MGPKNDIKMREIIRQAKELSKLLEKNLNLDEVIAGRVVFDLLLKEIASKMNIELIFKE